MRAIKTLSLLLLLVMTSVGLVACDSDQNQKITAKPKPNNNHNHEGPEEEPNGHGSDIEREVENLPKVGVMQGNWRVGRLDADNTPVMNISLIHDEGTPEADGDYTLFEGFDEYYHGTTGTDIKATMQGDVLTITFNPTPDPEQRFTIRTTRKVEDNRFEGTFTSADNAVNFQVSVARQVFNDPQPSAE